MGGVVLTLQFKPMADITAAELAAIVANLLLPQPVRAYGDKWDEVDDRIRRHFTVLATAATSGGLGGGLGDLDHQRQQREEEHIREAIRRTRELPE